jgi:transposase
MVCPLPVDLQNSIKSFLLQNTPFSVIKKRYPSVSLSTLTRYKKKFLSSATLPAGGRPSFVSVSTQQYIARTLQNGRQDGPKTVQEYLRSTEIDMLLSEVRKLLKRMGFKPRRKIKTNFISKKKQASSADMGQKTPEFYGRPVEAVGGF